jgi:hypothetical protein
MKNAEERKRKIKANAVDRIQSARFRLVGIEDMLAAMNAEASPFTSEGLYGLSLIIEDIRKKIKYSENMLESTDI